MLNITLDCVKCQRDEVLRYLGYRGQELTGAMQAAIDRCIREVEEKAKIRVVCRHFPLSHRQDGVLVENTGLVLTGSDIAKLLADSQSCYLLAATLGPEVDREIRYREQTRMSDAVIMDAAATALIEAVCDGVEEQLSQEAEKAGKLLTWRFSCGYGDLPLELQPQFLEVLDAARQVGIHCTKTNLMLPQKSVTAILGLSDKPAARPDGSCESCPCRDSCGLRKAGKICGR